jgi:nicotinamidase-related amidase
LTYVQKVYTDPASPLHCVGNDAVIANINRVLSVAETAGDLVVHVRHVHRADGSDAGSMFDFNGQPGDLPPPADRRIGQTNESPRPWRRERAGRVAV